MITHFNFFRFAIMASLLGHATLFLLGFTSVDYTASATPEKRLMSVSLTAPNAPKPVVSAKAVTKAPVSESVAKASPSEVVPTPVETVDSAKAEVAEVAQVVEDVDSVDVMPTVIHNIKPTYPSLAKQRGHEGTVVLKIKVLKTGSVDAIEVAQSSGHQLLDKAAVTAIQKWRFEPAQKNRRAVDHWVQLPVNFSLSRG